MKRISFLFCIGLAYFFSMDLGAQGLTCATADPFCSDTAESFPNNSGQGDAETGPDYGCLGSTPNPAWYYMQVGIAGDIELTIEQVDAFGSGLDVDFICWGPFPSLAGVCNDLDSGNEVDCSYETDFIETCIIPNAQVGEFYMVLITNFSDDPGTIDFQQTGGIGATDCNILEPCNVDAGTDDSFCAGGTAQLGGAPSASGGSNQFTYSWSPINGLSDPNASNPTATPINTTTYTLTVDDGQGCIVTDDVTVTILPDPIADAGPPQTLDCANTELFLDGGLSTAGTYAWTTIDGNITAGATSVFPSVNEDGTYVLTVTSAGGCTSQDNVLVNLGPLDATAVLNGPNSLCAGELGDFNVDLDLPGNWSITYSIEGTLVGPVDFMGTNFQFSSGTEGTYQIVSITNELCTASAIGEVVLDVEELPTLSFPIVDVILCPSEIESIAYELTGEGDITYIYSEVGINQVPSTSTAGNYQFDINTEGFYLPVSVSTAQCTGPVLGGFEAISVENPEAIFANDYTICQGEVANVQLAFTGNQPYEIQYTLDGDLQPIEQVNAAALTLPISEPGVLEIISLEDNFCTGAAINTSTVVVNPLPESSISGGGLYCSNETVDLEIDLIGTAPFTISYTRNGNAQMDIITNDMPYILSTDLAGDYIITNVTDALCNNLAQDDEVISHYPPIAVNIDYDSEVCEGDLVTITANPSGGHVDGYTYLWTDADGSTLESNPISFPVFADQNWSLVVNDACDLPNTTGVVNMDVQAYPTPSFIAFDDSLCIGELSTFSRDAIDGSVNCIWTFDSGAIETGCDQVSHTFFTPGYQSVNLSTSTSAGCTTSVDVDSVLFVNPDAAASFEFTPDGGTIFDPGVIFENTSDNAVDYLWEFGDGEISTEESPRHRYPEAISDNYPVCLSAFNILGCADTICDLVIIEPEYLMTAPNAFTPDNDNLNDSWAPVFNDIVLAEYLLRIYNRFGEVIFESTIQGERWHGPSTDSGEYYAQDGVYFYQVVTREQNRTEKREFYGQVTLLR